MTNNTNNTYYFDMDGVLANFHKEKYNFRNAMNREWIANLEPFMENVNLLNSMIDNGEDVYILSKAASEGAKQGKIEWLAKYCPNLTEDRIIIMVSKKGTSSRKIDYMRTEHGILIDDDVKNTRQWEKNGNPAILLEARGAAIVL